MYTMPIKVQTHLDDFHCILNLSTQQPFYFIAYFCRTFTISSLGDSGQRIGQNKQRTFLWSMQIVRIFNSKKRTALRQNKQKIISFFCHESLFGCAKCDGALGKNILWKYRRISMFMSNYFHFNKRRWNILDVIASNIGTQWCWTNV